MNKRKIRACGILMIFLISISVIGLKYNKTIKSPLISGGDDAVIIDARYDTFSSVIANNESSFRNGLFIKLYNKIKGVSITVNKGEYEFPADISLSELIDALCTGKYNISVRKVTIPEGYTIEQIAKTLEKNEVVGYDEFIAACKEYDLPSYVSKNKNRRYALEGYLFPDTYLFEKGMSANKVIDMMITRFEQIIKEVCSENDIKLAEEEIDEIVIKASVIEREVSNGNEKSVVSSVIDNRIKKGMKLQIDATVLYALGEHKDRVLYSDLKIASPYNTYYTKGLPIGPISNPGKDSLVAALFPDDTNYLYYMTKDSSNHQFFETYEEFLKYKNS